MIYEVRAKICMDVGANDACEAECRAKEFFEDAGVLDVEITSIERTTRTDED